MLMLSTLYTSLSLSLSPSLSCCNCYRHFHLLTVDGCMPNDECPGQQHANRNSMPEIDLSTQRAPNSILSILPPVFFFFFFLFIIFFVCFLLLRAQHVKSLECAKRNVPSSRPTNISSHHIAPRPMHDYAKLGDGVGGAPEGRKEHPMLSFLFQSREFKSVVRPSWLSSAHITHIVWPNVEPNNK